MKVFFLNKKEGNFFNPVCLHGTSSLQLSILQIILL